MCDGIKKIAMKTPDAVFDIAAYLGFSVACKASTWSSEDVRSTVEVLLRASASASGLLLRSTMAVDMVREGLRRIKDRGYRDLDENA